MKEKTIADVRKAIIKEFLGLQSKVVNSLDELCIEQNWLSKTLNASKREVKEKLQKMYELSEYAGNEVDEAFVKLLRYRVANSNIRGNKLLCDKGVAKIIWDVVSELESQQLEEEEAQKLMATTHTMYTLEKMAKAIGDKDLAYVIAAWNPQLWELDM